MMDTIVCFTYLIVLNRSVGSSSLVEDTDQGAMDFIQLNPRLFFNKTFSLRLSCHARDSLSCKLGGSLDVNSVAV